MLGFLRYDDLFLWMSRTMVMKRASAKSTNRQALPRRIDPDAGLTGLEPERFEKYTSEQRDPILKNIDDRYKAIVKDFYEMSNLCVKRHDRLMDQYRWWRYTAIVGTGILAALSFAVAKRSGGTVNASGLMTNSSVLPVISSIWALVLTVLANLETFANCAERAQAYRESRELYLDAAQEYDRAWSVSVFALGDTSVAYANATELYRRILGADRDLRRTFRDMTGAR